MDLRETEDVRITLVFFFFFFYLNHWKNEVALNKRKRLQKHDWEERPGVIPTGWV